MDLYKEEFRVSKKVGESIKVKFRSRYGKFITALVLPTGVFISQERGTSYEEVERVEAFAEQLKKKEFAV